MTSLQYLCGKILQMKAYKSVKYWLFTGCVMIAAMVVIGGITRLTDSGLSMVDWKLFMGSIPPTSEAEWLDKFEEYKQYPEYQKINFDITIEEFKSIFFWEYLHRLLGRVIGLVFFFPFLYFLIKGYFKKPMIGKLIVLFVLGGFQGFLGWYMVSSGLVDRPDVSHYRLAIHLISAFTLFAYTFWLALDYSYSESKDTPNKALRSFGLKTLALLTLQIIYGAYVAGLKAGMLCPTFPKMCDDWMPASMSNLNWTDDLYNIQFIHRTIAWVLAIWIMYGFLKMMKEKLSSSQKKSTQYLLGMLSIQFLLGVLTILMSVPVALGVLHQFGALLLLASVIYMIHRGTASQLPRTV